MAGLEARQGNQIGVAFEAHTSGIVVPANGWAKAQTTLTLNYPNARHRTSLMIVNMDESSTLYIGASGVAQANLFPIPAQGVFSVDLRERTSATFGTDIYMYAPGTSIDARVLELA